MREFILSCYLIFQFCTVNVCLHFWQIVAVIQPLSQLTQSAVPWSPGNLLGSLPLPGSSSGNQQANLLFWLLLANSLQVCIPCKFTGMLNRVGLGYLPFTWENRKIRLENQMVCAISFGKPQKCWAVFSPGRGLAVSPQENLR